MNDPNAALTRELYTEHAGALWRYAMRLTGDHARAEDVVQETLLRGWQHPHVTDDGERSPRAWLFRVARNLIIDERRSVRFRSEVSSPDGAMNSNNAGRTR
jgi:RNA polymerase sigma-70 factor (ECF subfamily)